LGDRPLIDDEHRDGGQAGPARNFFFGFFPNGFAADPLSYWGFAA
jgi:hypothetical protein